MACQYQPLVYCVFCRNAVKNGTVTPSLTPISFWILRDSIQGISVLQRSEGVRAAGGEWSWNPLSLQVTSKYSFHDGKHVWKKTFLWLMDKGIDWYFEENAIFVSWFSVSKLICYILFNIYNECLLSPPFPHLCDKLSRQSFGYSYMFTVQIWKKY